MTPMMFALVVLAGGLGAVGRFAVDAVVRAHTPQAAPWGTIAVNLTGSLTLGLVTGLVSAHALPEAYLFVVGAGFLGGYTTFSTASVETVRILGRRAYGPGMAVGLGTLVAATALAGAGLYLGALL